MYRTRTRQNLGRTKKSYILTIVHAFKYYYMMLNPPPYPPSTYPPPQIIHNLETRVFIIFLSS